MSVAREDVRRRSPQHQSELMRELTVAKVELLVGGVGTAEDACQLYSFPTPYLKDYSLVTAAHRQTVVTES